jgi:RNA polymerase sigma-70 factor (ECF subfamily)
MVWACHKDLGFAFQWSEVQLSWNACFQGEFLDVENHGLDRIRKRIHTGNSRYWISRIWQQIFPVYAFKIKNVRALMRNPPSSFRSVTFPLFVHTMSMNADPLTFHELYQRYSGDVYRFACWLSGNPDDADDLTAETFARVWTSDSEIRQESVKAYLLTIVRNLYLQGERRRKRHVPFDDYLGDPAKPHDEQLQIRSELESTMKAMQQLPEIDRTVLLMFAQEEMSYDEIASATGLTVSAAKVKVFRARVKLSTLVYKEKK